MTNITVYGIAYNEEFQLPHFINFYRSRFKNCNIVIYDNYSTDNTVNIARDNDCEVVFFNTNNKLSDSAYLNIKNNCWKNAKTDWVCVVDIDECTEVNDLDLEKENYYGNTILKFQGYNMVNLNDDLDINSIKHGVRDQNFDKSFIFNKKYVSNINYHPGCHTNNPDGILNYSKIQYKAYHFNFINLQMSLQKYKVYADRLSEENKKNGWGFHYLNNEKKIMEEFEFLRLNAIPVIT